ncbi:MAG: transporter substrate-binding domain-containing protein [Phocaeicola sp.]
MKTKIGFILWGISLFVGTLFANNTTINRKVVFYGGSNNPPFEFINEKGEPDGFHVELFKELMTLLGIDYELQLKEWDEAVEALRAKQIDGLIGHLQSTERLQYANFSIPTSYVYASVMHKKNEVYKSPSEVFSKRVLVLAGCKTEEYIAEHNIPIKTTRVDGFYDGFQLVEDGTYDIMVTNHVISSYYLKSHKKSNLAATTFNIIEPFAYCIAVNNENPVLYDRINNGLRQLKMNGRFDAIYNQWVVSDEGGDYSQVFLMLFVIIIALSVLGVLFALFMKRKVRKAVKQLDEEQRHTKIALEVGGLTAWEYNCKSKYFRVLHGDSMWEDGVQRMSFSYFVDHLHPDSKGDVIKILQQLESQELEDAMIKFCFKTPNEWRWFLTSYIPIIENETVVSLMGVRRDITWEVENQEVMQNTIKEISAHGDGLLKILDNIPTPIALKSIEENRYVYANKTSVELLGEIVGKKTAFKVLNTTLGENAEAIKAKGEYEASELIEAADGRVLVTMVKGVIIEYNNQPHSLICRVDLTEINKAKSDARLLSEFMPVLKGYYWQLDAQTDSLKLEHRMKSERDLSQITHLSQFCEIVHPEDLTQFLENVTWLKTGDRRLNREFQFRADIGKIGVYEWWEVFASIEIATENGKELRKLTGITVNIDERKRAELELQYLHGQHELVLNNISSILIHINSDYDVIWSNSIHSMDKKLALIYQPGQKCYESLGNSTPCDHCPAKQAMKTGMEACMEHCLSTNGEVYEATASPLKGDSGIEGAVIKLDNITDRKRLISELGAANKLMATLLDEVPAIFFMKDIQRDFRYVFASSAFCETVARKPREEIVGFTDYEVFENREIADKFRQDDLFLIDNCQSGEVVTIGEERVVIDEVRSVLDTKKLFLELPNGEKYLIGQSIDMTEMKRINNQLVVAKERAEEADKLKSAFLANMSHEIRTPLNAIVGFSQLLQESERVEERMEYSKIIETNNELLLRLISDILDLSKLEAGSVQLKPETFDLVACMEEIYLSQKSRGCHAGVDLRFVSPFAKCVVTLDKNRCLQIITNYLNNALKFTTQGFVEMGCDYQAGGLLLFVKDTGIGVSDDKRRRLFQRFQKLDDFAQGTGLGLSICKAIAETMQGRVWAESEEGKGSTFFAWIPCEAELELLKSDLVEASTFV